jgi:hypothetical protein
MLITSRDHRDPTNDWHTHRIVLETVDYPIRQSLRDAVSCDTYHRIQADVYWSISLSVFTSVWGAVYNSVRNTINSYDT